MRWVFLTIIFFQSALSYCASTKDDTVVCIHGFLGHPSTMHFLKKGFQKNGWEVVNWKYPSRDKTIQEHAQVLVESMQEWAASKPLQPLHFVAHSMGCLVLRAALNNPQCPYEAKIGRVVLMAPPNQGASWARWLRQFKLARKIAKDAAGKELMTERDFHHLGDFPMTAKVLVLAGNFSLNPIIEGENDGTIAVEETRLNTPHEHIVINAGHKGIVLSKKAFKLAKAFLEFEFDD
jgi:pimeloyl-ACP methyl ester carboxylesterase